MYFVISCCVQGISWQLSPLLEKALCFYAWCSMWYRNLLWCDEKSSLRTRTATWPLVMSLSCPVSNRIAGCCRVSDEQFIYKLQKVYILYTGTFCGRVSVCCGSAAVTEASCWRHPTRHPTLYYYTDTSLRALFHKSTSKQWMHMTQQQVQFLKPLVQLHPHLICDRFLSSYFSCLWNIIPCSWQTPF